MPFSCHSGASRSDEPGTHAHGPRRGCPGAAANPGIARVHGFRVRPYGPPRNDGYNFESDSQDDDFLSATLPALPQDDDFLSAAALTIVILRSSRSERLEGCIGLSRLLNRRGVTGEGGAADVADLVAVVEAAGAMHGLAVVPHHQIADAPLVRIDELALRRTTRKGGATQREFVYSHEWRVGMRGEEQRSAASH